METRLAEWFNLATKWEAILLIDEADVFLERRSLSDLARNSLVSGMSPVFQLNFTNPKQVTYDAVFLRSMEYYNGMLFLVSVLRTLKRLNPNLDHGQPIGWGILMMHFYLEFKLPSRTRSSTSNLRKESGTASLLNSVKRVRTSGSRGKLRITSRTTKLSNQWT